MPALINASIGDILIACKRQLIGAVDFFADKPEHVLIANKTIMPHLKEDRDVILQPGSFISMAPHFDGSGRINTRFRRYVNLTPRTKVSLDEGDSDEVALTQAPDGSTGFFPFEESCVDALSGFWPHDASLNQLSVEPMRIASGTDPAATNLENDWRDSIISFEVEYQFSFIGNDWRAPIITSADPDAGVVTNAYAFTFTADCPWPGTTPFTWTSNGTLPTGLTLNTSGILSGTPTKAGSYFCGIICTDANSQKAIRHYTITMTS